eukprot:9484710-Pyramimonas_sp.AAC.1
MGKGHEEVEEEEEEEESKDNVGIECVAVRGIIGRRPLECIGTKGQTRRLQPLLARPRNWLEVLH